jgi:hypothetical protein
VKQKAGWVYLTRRHGIDEYIFGRKHERKRPFGRHRCRQMDNIEADINTKVYSKKFPD